VGLWHEAGNARVMDVIRGRKARAIILSTAIGANKFGSQCAREDPHEIVKQSISRTIKATKCAEEQNRRGLHFVLEEVIGEDNEVREVMDNLICQEGIMVSNPYSIMSREGNFGWVMAKARVITNSVVVKDNINLTITGKHWTKTSNNKWMKDVVERAVKQEKDMTIMGVDNEAFVSEESEARQYWDDLSGKRLDPKLVKKARMEEMKEFNKHNVYVKVPIEECWTNTGTDPIGTRSVDVNGQS